MNLSPNRISTEITSEKIKIMNDIDLNSLFNLNYNFDLLKGIIETLLRNQELIQHQLDESFRDGMAKERKIVELQKEQESIKESYVDLKTFKDFTKEVKGLTRRVEGIDTKIEDSKNKKMFTYFLFYFF